MWDNKSIHLLVGHLQNVTSELNMSNASVDSNWTCPTDFRNVRPGREYMYYFIITTPICIATVLGNGLIIDAFRREKKARKASYYPILLLAIGDLSTGIAQPVMMILYYVRKSIGDTEYIQILNYSTFFVAAISSILGMLALTFDRFIGTTCPLKYQSTLTNTRKVVMAIIVFTPGLIIGLIIPLAWHNTYDPTVCYADWDLMQIIDPAYLAYLIIPFFLLVTVLFIVSYSAILLTAKKHLISRKRTLNQSSQRQTSAAHSRIKQSESKLLKTGFVIFGTFYICWLPLFIVLGMQVYGPENYIHDFLLIAIRSFATIPPLLNSAVNPIIYAFRIPIYKTHIKKVFCRCNRLGSNLTGLPSNSQSSPFRNRCINTDISTESTDTSAV